jgi:heme-binding NEAT domain protein
MALVAVEIVNNSNQTVRMTVDDGEQLDYLKTLQRRDTLQSVKVVPAPSAPARKPAAK